MAPPETTMEVLPDGVAIIRMCNPPVNALHPKVLKDLAACAKSAQESPAVKGIVITGAGESFCAGFDINQFASGGGGLDNDVNQMLCDLIEAGPKPTVAAIRGVALGGGLEVAMACNARICGPKTNLGLPELQLGIIPGFGGTQRLPRLVGLKKAVEMMLTSKPVKGAQAKKLGLVDAVCTDETVLMVARQMALAIAGGKKPRHNSLTRTDRLESSFEAKQIIQYSRGQSKKKSPHLQHPQFCLDAVETGIAKGGKAGLLKEAESFAKSAALDTHKALVHIFFAQRTTKKVKGVTDQGLKPRPIKCIAVIGGGLMGSGICTAAAFAGIRVILKEINEKFLQAGMDRIKSNVMSAVKKGRMKEQQAHFVLGLVKGTLDYSDFKRADMVIEAALEDIPLKQKIFADLEAACRPDCILASNTSTIDISLIGQKTRAADRLVGAHFFSPAHIMPLLEIVRTERTSSQVILDTLQFGAAIRKIPVVVGNCTGFAVNRCFFPYSMAACMLSDLGLDIYKVDKIIKGDFGMPMGPFSLSDLVGADIGVHVGANFIHSYPERVYQSTLYPSMVEKKRLGQKTGSGFYKYDEKRKATPDPDGVMPFLLQSRQAAKLQPVGGQLPNMTPQDIIEFIFFPVVNEGCRIIAEGYVDKPSDLDISVVFGMGFPAYRGGPIKWADLVGPSRVCERLDAFAQLLPQHAGFFKPCEYLRQCASSGTPLSKGLSGSSARL
mmetsp:Transcript_20088/g.50614  ORF Transcript_20088/g.50614 Transcript_20088/m.50614 type:complete len:723 (+) Transcript_20088:227-2395(+)|eukprot:jgi/Tetstr1/433114/TSEL_022446.t1